LLQKYDAAKQDIRFVRNNYKQTAGADYAQGLIELQQDNPAEAQISFETALSVDGNYYPAMFFLGVTHYLQGHATQARSYLNEYTRKFPANVRAQQILAVLDMREGKHADARQRLARVLALYPDDPATLKLMATVSMKLGDSAEAIEYMRKVAEQEPDSADARLRLGLGLMLQGEPEGGGAELQKAIEIDSELKAAEFVLILNQLNQGKLEEALAAAQAFTSRQPESPMAWNLLGLIQVRNDQPDAAQESFERALANVPGEPGAANNLALLALKRGDTAEAVRLYESVLEHHPGHMATLVKLAKLKTQSGQQSEVKELLEKTLKANPQALEPRILLGDIYLKQGKPGKAVTLLVEVQEEFAGHPLYWANLGRVQKAAGDTKGAVYSFERLVDLLPRSALAYQLLSEAYEENGNQDKLDRSLDKALALEPDHYPTRVRKLKLLIEQDKLEEAARLLQALQTAHPDQPELLLQQARLAQAQGKPGAAVKAYQEALKRAPNPDLLGQLALAQWQAGQREASFKTMQDWLEDHPEDTMVRYNLANLYLAAGRHEEARQAFARVIEAYPTHPVALTNLALLTRETDPDKALAYARLAHTFSPDAPVVQDALAQILLDRGDTDEALGLLEQAVETAPNDVKIRYHWAVALTKNGEKNRAINELRNILKQESRLVNEQEVRDLLQTLTGGEG
jgi:putative PEP-CTERM system TPR-repeat lipoprotein